MFSLISYHHTFLFIGDSKGSRGEIENVWEAVEYKGKKNKGWGETFNDTDKTSSSRLMDFFHLYICLYLNFGDSKFQNKNFKVFKHHLFVQYTKEIDSVNGFQKQQYLQWKENF